MDPICFLVPTEVWTTKILPLLNFNEFKRVMSVSKAFKALAHQSCPEAIHLSEEDVYPELLAFIAKNIHLCRSFSYGGGLISFPSIDNVAAVVKLLDSSIHKMKKLEDFRLTISDNLQTSLIFALVQKLPRKLKYLALPGYFPFHTLPANLRIETETLELVSRPHMEVAPELLERISVTKKIDFRDRQHKVTPLLWEGKLLPTIEEISVDIRENPRISEQVLPYSNIKSADFCDGISIKCLQNSMKTIERLEFWRTEIELVNVDLPKLTQLTIIESTTVNVKELFKCAPNLLDLSLLYSENVTDIEFSPKLKKLKLLNCGLNMLPESIYSLENLEKLSISNEQGQFTPGHLTKLTALKELEIRSGIDTTWLNTLSSMTQLENLVLLEYLLQLPLHKIEIAPNNSLTSLTGFRKMPEAPALANAKHLKSLTFHEYSGDLKPLIELKSLSFLHLTPVSFNPTIPDFIPFATGPITNPEWLEFIRDYAATGHVDFRRLRCLQYPNIEVRICSLTESEASQNNNIASADDLTEKIHLYYLPKEAYLEIFMIAEYNKRNSTAYALVLPEHTSLGAPLSESLTIYDLTKKNFRKLKIGADFKILEDAE